MPTKEQIALTKDSLPEYSKHLLTRHHHEVVHERLWLISRIQKASTVDELKKYKERYDILESLYPNESWKTYVDKIS
jgi:hypothetical protein